MTTTLAPSAASVLRLAAAQCLCYPDARLYEQLPLIRDALAELDTDHGLSAFLDHAAATRELDLAAHYVATFDSRNRRCLYLTWWTTGDTRNRGAALVAVKEYYRQHGMAGDFGGELPDFLPVMLEFAALTGEPGEELLERHRAGLELLRLSVEESRSPYAAVLRAVCATLPGPSPRTREEAKALARSGPPQELVGIDLAPAAAPTRPAPGDQPVAQPAGGLFSTSALWQKVTR